MPATAYEPLALHQALVEHGLIVPSGVAGVFGRSARFEEVLARLDQAIVKLAAEDGADALTFPPVMDRKLLEKTDYLDSFPNLAGTVFSFHGKEVDARTLSELVHAGEPWDATQSMTDCALCPAACYPVYPTFTGTLPAEGRLVTLMGWVFRNEPSAEPTRMQSFRVREYIRCGTPEQVVAWRDMWLARGMALLAALGLDALSDVAADPFFGRGGRMLAVNQKQQQLKFEVLVPVISESAPTAVCSFNYHQQHFGEAFGIHTDDGAVASSACLGFGMERVVMALYQAHGFDVAAWPASARATLWG